MLLSSSSSRQIAIEEEAIFPRICGVFKETAFQRKGHLHVGFYTAGGASDNPVGTGAADAAGTAAAIAQLIQHFRTSGITPTSTFDFENALNGLLREIGRLIVECIYNDLEPDEPELLPTRLHFDGEYYRRRKKTPNRLVATLLGTITLMRFLYQPVELAESSVSPLEICLGLEAGIATPPLADRVAQYSANCSQNQVQEILKRDHGIGWSVKTLRKVTASVSAGMAELFHLSERRVYGRSLGAISFRGEQGHQFVKLLPCFRRQHRFLQLVVGVRSHGRFLSKNTKLPKVSPIVPPESKISDPNPVSPKSTRSPLLHPDPIKLSARY